MKELTLPKKISAFMTKYNNSWLYILVLLYVVGVSIKNPAFMTVGNWDKIIRQVSVYGVISCGITFVMLTGNMDLSVGSMCNLLALSSCFFATAGNENLFLAIFVPILLGVILGLINGFLVGIVRLNSFVTTLGMMSVFSSVVLYAAKSVTSMYANENFAAYKFIGNGAIARIPLLAIIFAVVAIVSHIVLRKTVFGARIFKVGSNHVSAWYSGIKPSVIILLAYAICGGLTGVGGLMLSSRVMSVTTTMAHSYEFTCLTAVVLGGLSIKGGKGGILGTVIGVLILGIIDTSFVLMGMKSYIQYIVKGLILLIALISQVAGQRRRTV